jgi:hypothetical protein
MCHSRVLACELAERDDNEGFDVKGIPLSLFLINWKFPLTRIRTICSDGLMTLFDIGLLVVGISLFVTGEHLVAVMARKNSAKVLSVVHFQ